MDVRCAFLNGKPKEELYIFYPDGLPISNDFKILRLNKSLYGLKQSPRCWHSELQKTLIKLNLIPSEINPCLFFCKDKLKPFYLYVHVDDLLFGGSWVADLKAQIKLHFDMEDLHVSKYALAKSHNLLKTIFGQEIQSKLTVYYHPTFHCSPSCFVLSPSS
ncbi:hypothetical protein O181_077806, partial [Austropuccinia psidii MF-1]|nr:hypothetical protein [Austropuccinia psidii MF-1]